MAKEWRFYEAMTLKMRCERHFFTDRSRNFLGIRAILKDSEANRTWRVWRGVRRVCLESWMRCRAKKLTLTFPALLKTLILPFRKWGKGVFSAKRALITYVCRKDNIWQPRTGKNRRISSLSRLLLLTITTSFAFGNHWISTPSDFHRPWKAPRTMVQCP